jgi:protein phosphatase-4 regulatory subunit 3
MALTPQQGPDRKRVKVYELKNNDWYDRGTGFCSGLLNNVSAVETDLGGWARARCDLMGRGADATQDEARIQVASEDEPGRMLLETKISKEDGYQKQQGRWMHAREEGANMADTLIVWTDQNVTDMALSFQEAEGCAAIWLVPRLMD